MPPILIRGEVYPSINAAARHFGVHRITISRALDLGREDEIGLGHRGKPITANGETYNSLADACRAHGLDYCSAYRRIRNGGTFFPTSPGKPTKIGRKTYPSRAAASRATGIPLSTIRAAIARGTLHKLRRRK